MTAPYQPQMLKPTAPGQLSNTRGSNTGADAIGLQSKYSNPKGVSQALSLMRIVARRTAQGGLPVTPQFAWDSGWMGGQGAVQNLAYQVGSTIAGACGGNSTVTYNGRIYFMPSDGKLQSAPAAGPAVGTWRFENPLGGLSGNSLAIPPRVAWPWGFGAPGVQQIEILPSPTVYSMTIVANRLYAIATAVQPISNQATLYMTTINGDGTVGAWGLVPGGIIIQSDTTWKNSGCVGGWDGISATGFIVLWNLTLNVTTVTVNISDGSVTAAAVDSTRAQTVRRDNWAFACIGPSNTANQSMIFFIGGNLSGAAAVTAVVDKATINGSTGLSVGAFAAGAAIPLAKVAGTGYLLQDGNIYYIAGSTTTVQGQGTRDIYFNTTARVDAGTAWSSSANILTGNGQWQSGGAVIGSDYDVSTERTGLFPALALLGGQGTAGGFVTGCSARAINQGASPHDVLVPYSGNGTAAVGANFGTGGAIVSNQDGTQSATANYGGAGTSNATACGYNTFGSGFTDGDQVTITIVHVGVDGDYSPAVVTVIKIGQPPTITGITPTGATSDGLPNLAFSYNPGSGGGGPELSYQIQLKNGATVLFDSGVRYDGLNSVQSILAPYLTSGTLYTVSVTCSSIDTPMSGSSASAGPTTTTFTPTLGAAILAPTSLTATPNHAGGFNALAWLNGGAPGNGTRVYYRRNGSAQWILLFDSVATLIASFSAMDQIALTIGYDYAVSKTRSTDHTEGPLSNVVSNSIIDPVAGGYSAFLHVQGQGATHSVALLAQNTPDGRAKLDMRTSIPFQQVAPVARFGVAHYLELSVPAFLQDLAHLKSLQDVINTAYLGNALYYRDGFGAMITVAPMADHALVYRPPQFREVQINLLQIPNVFTPSTAIGSALGVLQQALGTVTPLDPSESIL